MDLDIADFAVEQALSLGAKYADVRLETTRKNEFLLKNGIPQMAGFDRSHGLGIKIVVNDCFGFACTNELETDSDREIVKDLVQKAVKVTRAASASSEPAKMSEASVEEASYEVAQKIKLEDLSPQDKLNTLFEIEKAIKSTNLDAPGRFFSLSDFFKEKYYVNSEGSKILSKIPSTEFWHVVTIKDNHKSSQRYWHYGDTGGWEKVVERGFAEKLKNDLLKLDMNLRKGVKPPKEKIDVVVGPEVTGIMVHESVGHPYEADRVLGREAAQAGETFIKEDMLKTKLGSNAVNIYDDPTIKGSFGFYLYDDDGVKARKRHLIKNGIINDFLHNRNTAAIMGTESNGSCRGTGYDRESIVRMANTYVGGSDQTEEELIEGVKRGILMRSFNEWNIDDKRLNAKYTGGDAYIIENGKVCEPVYAPIIEISTPALWSSVDATANNMEYHAGTCGKAEPMQPIPVWFGGPSMRIRNIQLGNK